MNVPKIKFIKMSLEENIEQIKWMYLDESKSLNCRNATIEYFPDLKEIDKLSSKDNIYKKIEKLVKECYEYSENKIDEDVKLYNEIWKKYNDQYFKELSRYLNVDWPSKIKVIEAHIGLIPIFPRYLDSFSFSMSFRLEREKVVEVAAHETLHFLWFEKWKELYPMCPRNEYDAPYMAWQYSEMVTDPILNSSRIKNILNVEEKAYDYFYEIKDGCSTLMDNLKRIFESDKKIEEKIVNGFEYVKKIIKD